MLEMMYKSACALYLPTNTPVFDILASIKCTDTQGTTTFIPFAASVKSRRTFGPKALSEELEKMKAEMESWYIQSALCVVILFDLKNSDTSAIDQYLLDISNLADLENSIVCKVLVIKSDDCFGIGKLVQSTRIGDNKECEIYSSHGMIRSLDPLFWTQAPSPRYGASAWQYAKDQCIDQTQQIPTKKRKRK